jgi:hypothetical protein
MAANPVIITQNRPYSFYVNKFRIFQKFSLYLLSNGRMEFESTRGKSPASLANHRWMAKAIAGFHWRDLKFVKTAGPATLPVGWALGAVASASRLHKDLSFLD